MYFYYINFCLFDFYNSKALLVSSLNSMALEKFPELLGVALVAPCSVGYHNGS